MKVDNALFFNTVEENLATGQPVKITLRGTSMLTTLHEGDTLTLAPIKGKLKVGDVVLFRHYGKHLLHRIVKIHGGRITLQGDNCYNSEHAVLEDIVAILTHVEGIGSTDSAEWASLSRKALKRKQVKNFLIHWLGSEGRNKMRPWYLFALFFLMWAPLNGMGIALDRFVLGIRGDHLLHATVFIPSTLFIMDLTRHRWLVWLMCVVLALLCEGVQYLLPYRSFDINDMIANTLGVTLGWLVILFALRAIHRQRRYPDLATP